MQEELIRTIQNLLTRGITVVTIDQARVLAEALERTLHQYSHRQTHLVFRVEAIGGKKLIMLRDLDEVERFHEEILDYDDRLSEGLIPADSVSILDFASWDAIGPLEREALTVALVPYCQYGSPDSYVPPLEVPLDHEESHVSETPLTDGEQAVAPESAQPILRFLNTPASTSPNQMTARPSNVSGDYEALIQNLSRPVKRWLPDEETIHRVAALREELPHMEPFLDEVLATVRMSERFSANRFTLPPMILNGPPGIGKTYCLFALSEALGLSMHNIPMSTSTAGFGLAGGERGWRDSSPGLLAKAAAKSDHINPIFILDEFEKAQFKTRENISGLEPVVLQMLERDSAQRFRDIYLEQDLNLSEVSYIGSSNEIERVPAPILSRVNVIEVGYPPAEALQRLYTSILNRALMEDFGINCLSIEVSGNTSGDSFKGISPRFVRNNAGRILSGLVLKARPGDYIKVTADELLKQVPVTGHQRRRGIGFLANL